MFRRITWRDFLDGVRLTVGTVALAGGASQFPACTAVRAAPFALLSLNRGM